MKPGPLLCLWNARSCLVHQKPKEHHALGGGTDLQPTLSPSAGELGLWSTVFPVTGGHGTHTGVLLDISGPDTYLRQLSFSEAPFAWWIFKAKLQFWVMKTFHLQAATSLPWQWREINPALYGSVCRRYCEPLGRTWVPLQCQWHGATCKHRVHFAIAISFLYFFVCILNWRIILKRDQ